MKKLLVGIACSLACASVLAAGPHDGVYQYGSLPVFASVHQNGSTLVVAALGSTPLNNINISVGAGYSVAPSSIQNWSHSIGTMSGSAARVTGIGVYGACTVTADMNFDGAGNLFSTFVSATNTQLGNQDGVNCAALYQSLVALLGPTLVLHKIF